LSNKYSFQTKPSTTITPKPNIGALTQEKNSHNMEYIISEIEQALDDFILKDDTTFNVQSLLIAHKVPSTIAKRIGKQFLPLHDEVEQAVNESDPYLVESYKYLTRKKLKNYYSFIQNIIDQCNQQKRVRRTAGKKQQPRRILSRARKIRKNNG
jgi:hypothetical protein